MKRLLSSGAIAAALLAIFGTGTRAQAQGYPGSWPLHCTITQTNTTCSFSLNNFKFCTLSAPSTSAFDGATLTAWDSGDGGNTFAKVSGSSDLGATPAPSQTLTSSGKLTFPVDAHDNFEVIATSAGSTTSVPIALRCQ